jgi:hypothetical protein
MMRQHIRAGLKRAVEAGQTARPEKRIQSQLRAGKGMLATAQALGVGTSTVQRIAIEMAAARPFEDASTAVA